VYRAQFSGYDTLTLDSGDHQFLLTDNTGRRTIFYDNSTSNPADMAGRLKTLLDRSNRQVTPDYNPDDACLMRIQQEADGQTNAFHYGSSGNCVGKK
jgi:hypothetical protein